MSTEIRPTSLETQASGTKVSAPAKPLRPDALLWSVAMFSWVTVWRIQDLFPILGAVKFPIWIELAVIAFFLRDRSKNRTLKGISSPILTILVILFVIMLLGLPFSLWRSQSLTFVSRDFIPTFVMMLVLASSMRESMDLEWFAFVHLVGAMLYAIEIFIHHPVGSDGRLANLVFYDANDFALLIVCTIPFAVFFLRPGVKLWKRLIAGYSIVHFVVMIMRSGSRGGFLGMIAVMLYILLRYRAVPAKFRIGAVIGGTALLLLAGSSQYWQMMGTMLHPKNDYNMTGDVGRRAVWLRGLGYMLENPVLGVGVRAFPQAEGMLSDIAKRYAEMGRGIKWSVAHNSFVEIGAECGIFALILFLVMLFLSLRTLANVQPKPRGSPPTTKDDSAFAQMLIAAFIGYIVAGFFVSAEYFAYLYVLLGLLLGQQAVLRRRRSLPQVEDPKSKQSGRPLRRSIGGLVKRKPGKGSAAPAPPAPWFPAGP